MTFEIKGLEGFVRAIEREGRNIHVRKKILLRKTANEGQNIMKKKAPVDTGRLKRSIFTEMKGIKGASIIPRVEYAPSLEYGRNGGKGRRVFVAPSRSELNKKIPEIGERFLRQIAQNLIK